MVIPNRVFFKLTTDRTIESRLFHSRNESLGQKAKAGSTTKVTGVEFDFTLAEFPDGALIVEGAAVVDTVVGPAGVISGAGATAHSFGIRAAQDLLSIIRVDDIVEVENDGVRVVVWSEIFLDKVVVVLEMVPDVLNSLVGHNSGFYNAPRNGGIMILIPAVD